MSKKRPNREPQPIMGSRTALDRAVAELETWPNWVLERSGMNQLIANYRADRDAEDAAARGRGRSLD